MAETFLTDQELEELTGSPQPAAQERILRSWGFVVHRNKANKIRLTREALTRSQLGEKTVIQREPALRMGG